jgi:bacterioferritin
VPLRRRASTTPIHARRSPGFSPQRRVTVRPFTFPEARMKGDPKVLTYLNQALRQELTAINQYFLHARMYENMGLKRLYDQERAESIDEMKHADKLIERILFLEGIPNLQELGKLLVGENVAEMLRCDLTLEQNARPMYQEAIAHCESVQDYISRELLEDILESEEDHIDWLETQLGLIDAVGLQNYIQSQMS